MRLLILGGTGWLSGHIAQCALAARHDVTCVSRGKTGALPDGAAWLQADRSDPTHVAALQSGEWDAAMDVSSHPGHVRSAAQALAGRCAHFVYVSSASVYASNALMNADESAPTLEPFAGDVLENMADYGNAKVACEQHVLAAFGLAHCTVARAGLIGGPGDASDRSGYWPWRFAQAQALGRRVLVPDAPNQGVQVIDVRDLAAWLLRCAVQHTSGVFNALGDSTSFGRVLQTAQHVAESTAPVQAASAKWLTEQGVTYWAGPKSLPLWVPAETHRGFGHRSNKKAVAAGLHRRPFEETLRDALAWEMVRPVPLQRKAGLSDADEAALLNLLADQYL